MIAEEFNVKIFNRDNCPCNFCRYCNIGNDFIYRCSRRRNKAISSLNPDLDTGWIVSDKEVSKCRCFAECSSFRTGGAR